MKFEYQSSPAVLLLVGSLLPSIASAFCSNYAPRANFFDAVPNDQTYTTSALRSYLVSARVECTGSALGTDVSNSFRCNATQCALTAPNNLLINVDSELNLTVSDEQKRNILALVKRNTTQLAGNPLYDFNSSATVSVGGSGTCIAEGSTRYWSLTPTLRCGEGILSGCTGSDSPVDGTAIRACGIQYFAVNRNGLGQPSMGPNIVISDGSGPAPGPANVTNVIDNSSPPGNAGLKLQLNPHWAFLPALGCLMIMIL